MSNPSDEDDELALVSSSFVVAGFAGDPDDITRCLSIAPDETGRAGEMRQLTGSQRQYKVPASYWELHGPKRRVATLEGCITGILSRIEPAADALRTLPSGTTRKILIQASMSARGPAPGMLLDANLIERLAKLGVSLEVDIN